jgi:NCS1 family nucleobase:cation symporter-1
LRSRDGQQNKTVSISTGALSLVIAIVVGWGLVTSTDPHIQKLLGYFLTPTAKDGSLGVSNIGVAVAFVVGGGLYAVLSSTVFRPAPAASHP